MRKVLLTAVLLGLAACGPKKGETGAADTTMSSPAMGGDSMSGMSHDSMMAPAGGMSSDSMMSRDSMKK